MGSRIRISLIALLAGASVGRSAQKQFRIQEDVLAFPQFDILFPDEYILESDAQSRLTSFYKSRLDSPLDSSQPPRSSSLAAQKDYAEQTPIQSKEADANTDDTDTLPWVNESIESFEQMVWDGQRFLCGVPKILTSSDDNDTGTTSASEQEDERARATSRGLELLRDMEGRCMYYAAGWWSYSFCYMNQVRQFHALLPGNGVPVYPPAEDTSTQSYVLGRFRQAHKDDDDGTVPGSAVTTEMATLQTKGESWYLVQYLEDGTTCDLTGKRRKIEVQFHCHPQSPDHIAWIKEVTTCSYLMVIYTPKLCNDVMFQPPREDQAHNIVCREILLPEEIPEWEAAQAAQAKRDLVDGPEMDTHVIGEIEVGAMKLVGQAGKRIEKGRVAFAGEETVEVVAKSEGGEVKRLTKEQLKQFNLDPEKIETLKKQLDELAGGKDWKLEMVDANGERGLRGVIDTDDEEENTESTGLESQGQSKSQSQSQKKDKKGTQQGKKKDSDRNAADEDTSEKGSDETYKEEL